MTEQSLDSRRAEVHIQNCTCTFQAGAGHVTDARCLNAQDHVVADAVAQAVKEQDERPCCHKEEMINEKAEESARLKDDNLGLTGAYTLAAQENGRLRAALQPILAIPDDDDPAMVALRDEVREALRTGGEGEPG